MQICDIATDVPNASDTIFIDTNVLLFQTYPGATTNLVSSRKSLIESYLKYIKRARTAGARFVVFPTVALELANAIEKEEYKELCRLKGVAPYPPDPSSAHSLKAFREDTGFRQTVASFAAQSWLETKLMASVPDAALSSTLCERAADAALSVGIDIMDSVHLALMLEHEVSIILSDDADFSILSNNVTLLTKNPKSISTAVDRGVLARR